MTYMTAMDRLEMCCIFLLEGLQTTRDGTWWQAELCCDTWGGGEGSPCLLLASNSHFLSTMETFGLVTSVSAYLPPDSHPRPHLFSPDQLKSSRCPSPRRRHLLLELCIYGQHLRVADEGEGHDGDGVCCLETHGTMSRRLLPHQAPPRFPGPTWPVGTCELRVK